MTNELFSIIIAGYGLLFFLSALRDFLSLFNPSKFRHKSEVIGFIILFGCAAAICWVYVCYSFATPPRAPALPTTRDILLRIPGSSSVNAQVTSGLVIVSSQQTAPSSLATSR